MKKIIVIFCVLVLWTSYGQDPYEYVSFVHPLKSSNILSGTFGELRTNHFHTGIDIKTKQREGLSIFAVEEGYISRIKIGLWGFGKALYITHPNGYTSVYAHLQKFAPPIETYIKKQQYHKKQFEIELFPHKEQFKVSKGQLVAFSGNTGSSSGPHLHFEIRNTLTQKPINPLLFNLKAKDTQAPRLEKLFVYPLKDNSVVNHSQKKIELPLKKLKKHTYTTDTVKAIGAIGFGVVTYDRQDLARNKNGIYELNLSINNTPHLQFSFDTFSFAENKHINTLIDFEHFMTLKERIQKCYISEYNPLNIYKLKKDRGILHLKVNEFYLVKISLKDLAGNTTTVNIPVLGKKTIPKILRKKTITEYPIVADKPLHIQLGIARIYFPAHTFYRDFYAVLENKNDTLIIHHNTEAIHKKFTINFDLKNKPKNSLKQLFIGQITKKNKIKYVKTYTRKGVLTAKVKELGTYTLSKDSLPPTIIPLNFSTKQNLSNHNYLKFKIKDDLSGIKKYDGFLNNQWILLEYDPKKEILTYDFKDWKEKNHTFHLRLTVTDKVGNTSDFSIDFTKKKTVP